MAAAKIGGNPRRLPARQSASSATGKQRESGVVRTLAVLREHLDPPGKLHDPAVLLHLREEPVGGREHGVRRVRRRAPISGCR